MTTNTYENTYVCVRDTKDTLRYLDRVVDFLRKQSEPMTCADIRFQLFNNCVSSAKVANDLRHLVKGGFVRREEREFPPVEIEYEDFVRVTDDGEPQMLRVKDDKGREYTIPNPNFNWCNSHGEWQTVKKTVTPKRNVYLWVGES